MFTLQVKAANSAEQKSTSHISTCGVQTWKLERVPTVRVAYISARRPRAVAKISAAIITGGRAPVSFYVAAARAWRAPTVSWHAAPHQRRNKSIFILTPAPPTPSPPTAPSPQPSSVQKRWFSALKRGRVEAELISTLLLLLFRIPLDSNEAAGCFSLNVIQRLRMTHEQAVCIHTCFSERSLHVKQAHGPSLQDPVQCAA